jgi:ABC-type arginine transport system ATPase subunit
VREHLIIYGRLKGLRSGSELKDNVDAILRATALVTYADRLASKLSGGNQRKLSLAIALMGMSFGTLPWSKHDVHVQQETHMSSSLMNSLLVSTLK